MAGHSLGEYSALVAGHALNFSDAVPLVRFRAKSMQEAVPLGIGGMAAIIGIDAEIIKEICQEINAASNIYKVEIANYNSLEQTVIAGHIEQLEKTCSILKQKGAKRALILPVSAPFHSSLLTPAGEKLHDYLQNINIKAPNIPIINNIDVNIYNSHTNSNEIKQALVRQVYSSVRWVETIQKMEQEFNVNNFVECGPGKVLQGLIKRIIAIANTDIDADKEVNISSAL